MDGLLELGECALRECPEVLGRAMDGELPRGGAFVLRDKEELELFYVIARHAEGEIAGEGDGYRRDGYG